MSDNPKKEPPESVRKIVEAMVGQAIARCERQGIPLEHFYRAMLEEEKVLPRGNLADLFERIFHRLRGTAN